MFVRAMCLTGMAQAWQLNGERLMARSNTAFLPVSGALSFHGTPFLMTTVECISVVDAHLRNGSRTMLGVADTMWMNFAKLSNNENASTWNGNGTVGRKEDEETREGRKRERE